MPTSASLPPLLLVPGLMCDQAVWQPVLPALQGLCACSVVDHRQADSLTTMAQQLLLTAPPRFALAGHSMGARVALEVLRLAPQRVDRLALLDSGFLARAPGAAGQDEERKRMALLRTAQQEGVRSMATQWVQGMVHPARLQDAPLMEAILSMFERKTADTFAHQIQALLQRPDASAVLAAVAVPAMVLCGRQDSWAPVAQHAAMQALIPASELVVIEEAGHMAPMERPDAVAAAMVAWLHANPH